MHVQAINGRCLKCGYRLAWVLVRGKTSAELGASRFNVGTPWSQKRKTGLKLSGRSLQSSETFVSELSFRTSTGVTAQGTVASPARLPHPFGSLLMLHTDDTERVLQSQIALLFSWSRFARAVMFSRSRPPDLVNSRSLHDWPKDRLLCPKDRIYFSSAKAIKLRSEKKVV